MPERQQPHQLQIHPQRPYEGGVKTLLPKKGPSAGQVMAVLTLLPLGGTLLTLAGVTLVGSLIGLAVTTPLFIIFSPVLVPAAIVVGLAVVSFLASGVLGLTGLSSLSRFFDYLRQAASSVTERLDRAKRGMQDMAGQMGQKTTELGQTIQTKAQEGGRM